MPFKTGDWLSFAMFVCLLENSHCLAGCEMLHQGRLSRKSQLKHCNRWHQLYFLLPVDQVRLFGPLNLMNPHIWDHRIQVLNIRGIGNCFRVSACRTNTLFGSLSILGRSGAWRIAVSAEGACLTHDANIYKGVVFGNSCVVSETPSCSVTMESRVFNVCAMTRILWFQQLFEPFPEPGWKRRSVQHVFWTP